MTNPLELQPPGVCGCVAEHRPAMLEYHVHHVWPLADEGPDEDWNKVIACPTTHANVHKIYRRFKKNMAIDARQVGEPWYAYNLAKLGFTRWKDAGFP